MKLISREIVLIILLAFSVLAFGDGNYNKFSCANCFTYRGELKNLTKFSIINSEEVYSIIELSDGRLFVFRGSLILGPVGSELEIYAENDVHKFPNELQNLYKSAQAAIRVKILSYPTGLEGLRIPLKSEN